MIRPKSESELQKLIKTRPDYFLPLDSINGKKSGEWPIVLEEYNLGNKNIDFLLIDKNATPVFVECKLCKNSEAKGGIVWQMIDYFAHSKFITAEILHERTLLSYISDNIIKKRLLTTKSPYFEPNTFFEKVVENLKNEKIILVFYLDQVPDQLVITVKELKKIFAGSKIQLFIFELGSSEENDCKPIKHTWIDSVVPDSTLSSSEKKQLEFYKSLELSNNDFLFNSIAKRIEHTEISLKDKHADWFRYTVKSNNYQFYLAIKDKEMIFQPETENLKSKIPANQRIIKNFSTWEKIEGILLNRNSNKNA